MLPQHQIPPPAHRYTAAQLAVALRISKRNTQNALAGVEPCAKVLVQGNETSVWSFDQLPERLRKIIASHAQQNQLSVADYLAAGLKIWQPETPISEISADCLNDTQKLREALLPALQRIGAPMFSPGDLVRLGLADYERVFGHAVSDRHWRRLMDRTVLRDAGARNFTRLEIYLPEKPARKTMPARDANALKDDLLLADFISTFSDPTKPTHKEVAALSGHIFDWCGVTDANTREWKRIRKVVAKRLYSILPCLAASERALRVKLDRKFKRWLAAGGFASALLDGRIEKRGVPVAKPFPKEDVDLIMAAAALHWGGKVAPALRDLAQKGERSGLSAETVEVISRYRKRKSDFNRRLVDRVKYDVRMVMPHFLGKKAKDDVAAHVERDYSKLSSMEIINADDFTLPVYFYVPDGKGWFTLMRGQCLLMLDVRSWKIIAWSLLPEPSYNSLAVRTLMNRVCMGHGIPGTWYFERGIWKKSHVVKGTAPTGWSFAGAGADFQTGWQKLGVKFLHAIRARSKPVERVGGLLQDRMHGVRGYCGRNERVDCPEVTKRAMQDVEFHRVNHPGELFLSFNEWHAQLAEIIAHYNASSQDGRVLQGLSPDEAFEKYWPHDNPPARLDANSWHLVAHHVRPLPVTENGIAFRIGAKSYVYRNERSGQDRGKKVLAWFDPDTPEFILVTDLESRNPYLVERSNAVDFRAAAGDAAFESEMAKAASHSLYPRARFNMIKEKFKPTYRRNFVDARTAETAQEMNRLRENKISEQKQLDSNTRRIQRIQSKTGIRLPRINSQADPDELKFLAEFLSSESATAAGEFPETQ